MISSPSSYTLGLTFILLVNIIWAGASILVQYLYTNLHFQSPFLLTYICTSLFIMYIPTRLLYERLYMIRAYYSNLFFPSFKSSYQQIVGGEDMQEEEDEERTRHDEDDGIMRINNRNNHNNLQDQQQYDDTSTNIIPWKHLSTSKLSSSSSSSLESLLVQQVEMHQRTNTKHNKNDIYTTVNDTDPRAGNDPSFISPSSSTLDDETINSNPLSTSSTSNSILLNDNENNQQFSKTSDKEIPPPPTTTTTTQILSHVDHIQIASCIAPIWFLSNFCYNISLAYTSITSSTLLASTGSIFTCLFAWIGQTEEMRYEKVLGVFLAFMGSMIRSLHDASVEEEEKNHGSYLVLWGDIAGILSAIGYGAYTVLIAKKCPSDERRMSMMLLLGYIGLINMICLSPGAIYVLWNEFHYSNYHDSKSNMNNGGGRLLSTTTIVTTQEYYEQQQQVGEEHVQHLSWFIFKCLVFKGLIDNVLSDYLWARAVILTSSTVATVGLGLTIPLAMLSDSFIMGREDVWNPVAMLGASLVLIGFLLVNVGDLMHVNKKEYERTNQMEDGIMDDSVVVVDEVSH